MTTVGRSGKAGLAGGFKECSAEKVLLMKVGKANMITIRRFIMIVMSTTSGETILVAPFGREGQEVTLDKDSTCTNARKLGLVG